MSSQIDTSVMESSPKSKLYKSSRKQSAKSRISPNRFRKVYFGKYKEISSPQTERALLKVWMDNDDLEAQELTSNNE